MEDYKYLRECRKRTWRVKDWKGREMYWYESRPRKVTTAGDEKSEDHIYRHRINNFYLKG
jgi:hypothetical protein